MRYPLSIFNFKGPAGFLCKFFGYAAVYALLHITVVNYFLNKKDYAWGETLDFRRKLAFLRSNADRFNTVFLGSSIIKNNIHPCVFDSVAAAAGAPIHSYNLGTDGLYVPATYFMAEQLLLDTALRLRTLFVDYDGINDITHLAHTEKSNYWINASWLRFTVATILEGSSTVGTKAKLIYQYTQAWVKKNTAAGKNTRLFCEDDEVGNPGSFENAHQGFVSLEHQLEMEKKNKNGVLSGRRQNFLNDTTRLRWALVQGIEMANKTSNLNQNLVNKLEYLTNLAIKKGIQLIYLFQPRNATKDIYSEFRRLPAGARIDQSLNPVLYEAANHFDNRHLDNEGAAYFSEVIATDFLRIIAMNGDN